MTTYSLPLNTDNSYLFFGKISVDGRLGLPNSVREGLLGLGFGKSALVLDAVLMAGWLPGKAFTFKKCWAFLTEAGIQLSEALIREGLSLIKSGKMKATRGRPEVIYQIPTIQVLAAKYAGGFISVTDVLEVEDILSMKLYRQGLYREFIKRRPGIYSRNFLSQRLGVGKRTTRNYDRRCGVKVDRRESEDSYFTYYMNWEDYIEGCTPGKQWLRLYFDDGKVINAPLKVGIVQRWAWQPGVKVKIVTQLANRYSLAA